MRNIFLIYIVNLLLGCGQSMPSKPTAGASSGIGPKVVEEIETSASEDATADLGKSEASADEISAFANTLYPLLVVNCASCHSEVQPQGPTFAHSDIKLAYQSLFDSGKINVISPNSSRVAQKVVEGHNCWSDCPSNGKELGDAALAFVKAAGLELPVVSGLVTGAITLSAGKTGKAAVTDGLTLLLEAETATLAGIMRKNSDAAQASGPNKEYIYTRTDESDVARIDTAPALADADAAATLTFNVANAGKYFLWMKTRAIGQANDSIFIRINGELANTGGTNPGRWNIPVSDPVDQFLWNKAPAEVDLAAGNTTVTIQRRELDVDIDVVVLTMDAAFTGDGLATAGLTQSLEFDLSELLGLAGAGIKFAVDIAEQSTDAYKVWNARIISPNKAVRIRSPKILVNGIYQPHHNAFNNVNIELPAPGGVISDQSMIVVREMAAPAEDSFSFTFDELTVIE